MVTSVKLTYFKKSGKYYTEAEYLSDHPSSHLWMITDEVKEFHHNGTLPGLVKGGGKEFNILVVPEDGVPALITDFSKTPEYKKI